MESMVEKFFASIESRLDGIDISCEEGSVGKAWTDPNLYSKMMDALKVGDYVGACAYSYHLWERKVNRARNRQEIRN